MAEANPYQPPSSDPHSSGPSSTAKGQLKKTYVLLVMLLNLITLGFYAPYWYASRRKSFNRLAGSNEIGLGLCILAFILHVVYLLAPLPQENASSPITGLAFVVFLVYAIVFLVLAFKVKGILETNYHDRFSPVLTFFFQLVYLQFKINRLDEPVDDALQATSSFLSIR